MSTDEPTNVVDEALDEKTSSEKSDDEIDKNEIDNNESNREQIEVPNNPIPSRRGGKRRRRGGRRPVPQERPQAKITENDCVNNEVKTDDGEIEVTQDKSIEDNEVKVEGTDEPDENEGDEAEEREPSPVVTRRSNRRQQQKKEENVDSSDDIPNITEKDGEEIKEEGTNEPLETMDQDEVESVTSELDSIASGSTLTTRSRRRGGPGPHAGTAKGKKVGGRCSKASANNALNSSSTKGKSRRIIFKKSATRAPAAVAKAVTSDRVYYRGQYYTKGDVVSVEDVEDGSVYYAQLRGFLTDQYCEKSGVITWLLPTVNSPPAEESFDPSTYLIGPEEELPRKLEYFTFVMHAPDDYFYYRNAPYPTMAIQTDQEYLVTRQGPRVRMIKAGRPVYQDNVPPLIPMHVQDS